MRDHYLA
jgi:ubiquitin C-terminal hydrolase